MPERKIGKITHFFPKISVAVVEITDGELAVGDTVHIKGQATDFEQAVGSMQIEHESVEKVQAGKSAGLKVDEAVREGDEVYKAAE